MQTKQQFEPVMYLTPISPRFVLLVVTLAIHYETHSAELTTQLDDPHAWYWPGHWHLWHGGWPYWWLIPLLGVLLGGVMFHLGRRSAKYPRKPPSDRSV
jgi:hypothetical protein